MVRPTMVFTELQESLSSIFAPVWLLDMQLYDNTFARRAKNIMLSIA